jgi:DNA-binding FrmR family transcriptional regulator
VKYEENVRNRLRRVEGQIGGVLRMMEGQQGCKEVVAQLSAARNAVDRIIALLVVANLQQCLLDEFQNGEEGESSQMLDEAVRLLINSR